MSNILHAREVPVIPQDYSRQEKEVHEHLRALGAQRYDPLRFAQRMHETIIYVPEGPMRFMLAQGMKDNKVIHVQSAYLVSGEFGTVPQYGPWQEEAKNALGGLSLEERLKRRKDAITLFRGISVPLLIVPEVGIITHDENILGGKEHKPKKIRFQLRNVYEFTPQLLVSWIYYLLIVILK